MKHKLAPGKTFHPFIQHVRKVLKKGSDYTETNNVFSLLQVIGADKFYVWSYQGSLTTPGKLKSLIPTT